MHVMDRFGLSERKACRLVDLNRSSKQYKPSKRDDSEIRARIRELAEKHKKYGSPMIHAILRREGYMLNHKKTERIYREERLSLRKKVRRKLPARARVPRERATRVNEVWSMDFVSDSLADGRKFRVLTIIDDFTRFCPGMAVSSSLPARRVTRFLDEVAYISGYPERIRVDNGPEFISRDFSSWARKRGIEVEYIRPGKPTDNSFIESFNGKFRDECLNENWFMSIQESRRVIEAWRIEYNSYRPHSSLGNATPDEFTGKHMVMLNSKTLALKMA